ncbi:hypothetical protein [Arthrobacter sp. H14-L1]|uniref:hypothetical protein n=1 Tax=Arthrobacter sp. H14-L1 TaxID=2996697 RepID=UPI002270CD34|nr:hypothetical protein [Arthrobacter sp. H14-L1]MCY0906556.1 hypothetical protein [Arthrobacter sp. H14-L1]
MRYPQLWEAVKTTWHRDASERSSPARVLVDHVNYILTNRYRRERRFGANVRGGPAPDITNRSVNGEITVRVDGVEIRGVEIDTDPFVYGVGASLERGGVLTAVLPRDELKYIRVEFAKRS